MQLMSLVAKNPWALIGTTTLIAACQQKAAEVAESPAPNPSTFWTEEPWLGGSQRPEISKTAPKVAQNGTNYSLQICTRQSDNAEDLDRRVYLDLVAMWKISTPEGKQCRTRIEAYLNPPPPKKSEKEVKRIDFGNGYSAEYSVSRMSVVARSVLTAYIANWDQDRLSQDDTRFTTQTTGQTCEVRSRFDGEVVYQGQILDVAVNFTGAKFMCGVDEKGERTYRFPD